MKIVNFKDYLKNLGNHISFHRTPKKIKSKPDLYNTVSQDRIVNRSWTTVQLTGLIYFILPKKPSFLLNRVKYKELGFSRISLTHHQGQLQLKHTIFISSNITSRYTIFVSVEWTREAALADEAQHTPQHLLLDGTIPIHVVYTNDATHTTNSNRFF